MGVETSELLSETWTRWQGHVINGMYPLGRFLGCSDHSGVFLTEHASRTASPVAIKLLSTSRHLAISQLPRWRRASGWIHPHLLHLWELGGCQLDGAPYLYAVMDYADQTLAQLLQHRALTESEAHEMLPPILDALTFLQGKGLVQGQLKPTNILVVDDQIKLASDTVRRASERAIGTGGPTLYDPPEDRIGHNSTAGDLWALGITLIEATTRRRPSDWLASAGDAVVLPPDLPPTLRELVGRCLQRNPQDRPSAAELFDRVRGRSSALNQPLSQKPSSQPPAAVPVSPSAALSPSTALPPAEPPPPAAALPPATSSATGLAPLASPPPVAAFSPEPLPEPEVTRIASTAAWPASSPPNAQRLSTLSIALVGAAAVLVLLGWFGVHEFRATTVATPPPPAPAVSAETPPDPLHAATSKQPSSSAATKPSARVPAAAPPAPKQAAAGTPPVTAGTVAPVIP